MNKKESNAVPDPVAVDPRSDEWLSGDVGRPSEELAEAVARLKSLCVLSQTVYLNQTAGQILEVAVAFLDRLLCPERCILAVFGDEGEVSEVRSKGIDAEAPLSDWPVSQSILCKVRQDYVALLSTDAQKDKRLKDFKSVGALNIRSVLCVPLGTESDHRGIVYLDSRLETKAFNKSDLLFLTAVCRYLDLAIHHAAQLREAKEQAQLSEQRVLCLREELFRKHKIVGVSPAMVNAYKKIKQIAATPLSIVLTGETGTGKELFARAAHLSSPRADGPFVVTNLAAINPNLIESELFGHEAGAFTGANQKRIGLLERANGGTLFLDEIARAPNETQFKLLRAIEQKDFQRVGGNASIRSDFRVIAATSRDLQSMIEEGRFLPDLYYRLAEAAISLPPLRDRKEDIPLLARHFLEQDGLGRRFSSGAMRALQQHPWPGSVRELRSAVLAIVWTTDADPIHPEHVVRCMRLQAAPSTSGQFVPLAQRLAEVEREHIARALEIAGGNKNRAMELLGMARATFFERLKRYRL